ncbi:KPN_02809 family neutral zinc metallopeptidase [Gemmobacter nectariphilus]|uniref:KPN_02809 family neutral zinc metallopeptidase n=1 Tax=Gemmobacter nectariphilus TaxID=220343 RepID=UPI0003F8E276|nr:neutral zinc metallopeptidase [Gemmobacter nectariphilus]
MRFGGQRQSRNVEDRRGSGRGGPGIGGISGLALLAVLAIGYFTGIDVTPLLQGLEQGGAPGERRALTPDEQQAGVWVSQVLGTTEDVWAERFRNELGARYAPPVLVLYSGVTQSPCGNASGATGPFYCPGDRKIYLDTEFFATLSRQLGAPGEIAAAYVIAHEVAHHVQDELGILGKANAARARMVPAEANAVSVRIELQADCLAGVWAESVNALLKPGDVEQAINAARQIGDDTLQRRAGKVPRPHTFSHGSSAQRVRWFTTGYEQGRMEACDTFGTHRP